MLWSQMLIVLSLSKRSMKKLNYEKVDEINLSKASIFETSEKSFRIISQGQVYNFTADDENSSLCFIRHFKNAAVLLKHPDLNSFVPAGLNAYENIIKNDMERLDVSIPAVYAETFNNVDIYYRICYIDQHGEVNGDISLIVYENGDDISPILQLSKNSKKIVAAVNFKGDGSLLYTFKTKNSISFNVDSNTNISSSISHSTCPIFKEKFFGLISKIISTKRKDSCYLNYNDRNMYSNILANFLSSHLYKAQNNAVTFLNNILSRSSSRSSFFLEYSSKNNRDKLRRSRSRTGQMILTDQEQRRSNESIVSTRISSAYRYDNDNLSFKSALSRAPSIKKNSGKMFLQRSKAVLEMSIHQVIAKMITIIEEKSSGLNAKNLYNISGLEGEIKYDKFIKMIIGYFFNLLQILREKDWLN